jgi:hypothetical protein
LEPVGGLDVKRHPVRFNTKIPYFNREPFSRFAEHPVKKVHGGPVQKYRLVAVYRRNDPVPSEGFKYTRFSHIYSPLPYIWC